MIAKNNFLVTDPNASFIELQKLLKGTAIPKDKLGDIKFIDRAIEFIDVSETVRKRLFELVDDLMFRNQNSKK